ncbi:hypothetical protein ACHMW6_24505 [Pseudoduganella sp. UC29_106]|uniref:hypothetical protein n=1 Tax=Pseudoduganella sp. UC29_106 TaxID=3374553 RepID=UPI003757F43C
MHNQPGIENETIQILNGRAGIRRPDDGAAGSAQADAHAVAYANIQNFAVTAQNGGITFTNSVDTSTASATLNGVGAGPTGGTAISDAPIAVVGTTAPPVSNNSQFTATTITPVGAAGPGDYSYADARIVHAPCLTPKRSPRATWRPPAPPTASAPTPRHRASPAHHDRRRGTVPDFAFSADALISTFLQVDSGLFAQGPERIAENYL